MADDLDTTTTADDELDQLAAQTSSSNHSSPELQEKVNQAVGLYLKRQPSELASTEHQGELEALLGKQWAAEISSAQANYYEQNAQFCREGSEQGKHSEADPVMMFNGQFGHNATDVSINGAGMDFVFVRTYKNQAFTRGPVGYNWDHNYNLWLREEGNTLVRSSGELREDRYVRHEINPYYVPPHGFHDTIEPDGDTFTLRTPSGVRFFYGREGQTERHLVRRVQDRNGNYLALTYDASGRLGRVEINSLNRWVTFQYDNLSRITSITAYPVTHSHSGSPKQTSRVWRYTYDDFGDLVAVTTPGTEQHPIGLTTLYEYSSDCFSGELAHNLLRIYDPAGQLYLENEYGIQKGVLTYNRVVRQRQGNGEYQFEYGDVLPETSWNYRPEEIPAHHTLLCQRNGHVVEHIYNRFGNLIATSESILDDCDRRELVARYRYNRDGALVASLSPEGSVAQFYYGRDDFYGGTIGPGDRSLEPWRDPRLTAAERTKFGNRLADVKRGRVYTLAMLNLARGMYGDIFPSIWATDAKDEIVKTTFEPFYQQVLSISDPRFTKSIDPRHVEVTNPTSMYNSHLTRFEYSPLPRKNLSKTNYPNTTFPSPLPGGVRGLANISEAYLKYDARGRLEQARDPEGNFNERVYYQSATPTDPKDGYLYKDIRDAHNLALTTTSEANEAGAVTASINPRGVRTTVTINELGQVTDSALGSPGFRTRSYYGANGLLERQERANLDALGQASPDGDAIRTFRYDAQNSLILETIGGSDLANHLVIRHRYDSADKRVETSLPRRNLVRYAFNERLLLRSTTRGAGTPQAATVLYQYDGDGRTIATIDARGNVTRFRYDSLNRLAAMTDAMGNLRQTEYDKLGNSIVERFFQPRPDAAHDLLCRRSYEYDERGNRVREVAHLFRAPIRTANVALTPDAEFDTALAQGLATPVVTQFFYDRNRRLFRILDAQDRETFYEYDGANRKAVARDALGNYIRTSYDENGNVSRVDRHEVVRNPQTGAILREEVFSSLNEYDDLDRRTAMVDGLGNRTMLTYDSRNNLTSVTDPLGNVIRHEYDVFGRRTREVVEMTTTGLGGGPRLADIPTGCEYDDNGNRVAVNDARSARTRFDFDPLDRAFRTVYQDGTDTSCEYDLDDNVVTRVNSNGLRILYDIDPLKRVTSVRLEKAGVHPGFPYSAGAEEFEQYEYDGLGRAILHRNDFCEVRAKFDSLGRAFEEQVHFTTPYWQPAGPLFLSRSFDTLSNRTKLVYPNGREVLYSYDDLSRTARIANLTNGVGYPGSTSVSGQREIARYEYQGLRLNRAILSNGVSSDFTYDGNGRTIGLRHEFGATTLLETQQLFDGAGNRRYQRDDPPTLGRHQGEAYAYDSIYQITRFDRKSISALNLAQFAPPAKPALPSALIGQQIINQAIGSLAQDPLNFTYSYDTLGNRLEERHPHQPPLTYTANLLNQYEYVGPAAYQYDRDGNLIDDGARLYRYNYRDRLSKVMDKSTGVELLRLLYDASGRTIVFNGSGGAVHLLYDGPSVIAEYAGGNLLSQYVNENTVDRRVQAAQGGEEWWYHLDVLGSIRLLTDTAGQSVARYEYDPFGLLAIPVTHPNPYAFGGKRLIGDLNLYDSRARQYSPSLGRFLQRDPKGLVDGLNLYVYVGNSPATFIDLFGTDKAVASATILSLTPIDQLKGLLDPLRDTKFIGALPPESTQAIGDPADSAIAMLRTVVEARVPGIQILTVGPFRDLAKGVGVSFNAGACFVWCVLNAEVDFGVYLSAPTGPNDHYFHDMHPFLTLGGSFGGVSPGSGVDWLNPTDETGTDPSDLQLNMGMGIGAGASAFGFLSQATTNNDYNGWARQLNASVGPFTGSMSANQSAQATGSLGGGLSVGAGIQVYNTYTWTTGGVRNWLQPAP